MNIVVHSSGILTFRNDTFRVSIGRGGIVAEKREGDGASPEGIWPLRRVLYRADRLQRPETNLPLSTISLEDGWCDAPGNPVYNMPVKLPYSASHEELWRNDRLYDVIVVIGYNDNPVIADKGSAIFLHVATDDYTPTAGCAALALDDLLNLLAELGPGSMLEFRA